MQTGSLWIHLALIAQLQIGSHAGSTMLAPLPMQEKLRAGVAMIDPSSELLLFLVQQRIMWQAQLLWMRWEALRLTLPAEISIPAPCSSQVLSSAGAQQIASQLQHWISRPRLVQQSLTFRSLAFAFAREAQIACPAALCHGIQPISGLQMESAISYCRHHCQRQPCGLHSRRCLTRVSLCSYHSEAYCKQEFLKIQLQSWVLLQLGLLQDSWPWPHRSTPTAPLFPLEWTCGIPSVQAAAHPCV